MSDHPETPIPRRPGLVTSILLVIGVVPFMAGLLGLFSLLGIAQPWFGFLFLVYWAAIQHQRPADYPSAVIGGAGGIALAWALFAWPAAGGTAGVAAPPLLLAATLFCFMRGHLRPLFNNAMMLFLTVASIPSLRVAETAPAMIAALAVGAAYMGAVAAIARGVAARLARGQARRTRS